MTNEHDITSTYEITGFERGEGTHDASSDPSFDRFIDQSFERLIDRSSEPPSDAPIDAALRAYSVEHPSFCTIPSERFRPMTLTIDVLHLAIRRAVPRIQRYRETIAAELPHIDLRAIDGLERRNTAMEVAQRNYERAMAPVPTSLPVDEASEARASMLAELGALADEGKLEPARLRVFRRDKSYLSLAHDLEGSVAMLDELAAREPALTLHTSPEARARARVMARLIADSIAERSARPARLAEASRLRQQAFTWTLMAYDVARRAIHYVRFEHGDADEITPALCPVRTRRGPDDGFFFDLDPLEVEPEPEPEPDTKPATEPRIPRSMPPPLPAELVARRAARLAAAPPPASPPDPQT